MATKKTDEDDGEGFGDKWDDKAKVGGSRADYKPGDYLVLLTQNTWIGKPEFPKEKHPRLKIGGLVLLCLEDLGDSNGIGDEVEEPLFYKEDVREGSFFETGTKAWLKAALNLPKAEVQDYSQGKIRRLLVKEQVTTGRVVEIKVRVELARARKDGKNPWEGLSFPRFTPQRAFSEAELKALIKRQDAKTKERVMAVINDESSPALVYPDNALAEGEEAE